MVSNLFEGDFNRTNKVKYDFPIFPDNLPQRYILKPVIKCILDVFFLIL